jgi:iron(III) transport system ATP-binding protein
MSTITIRGLTKSFDHNVVLQNLSLTIPNGSFFTLLGPSGCGKTTLLRCIAGFNDPDSGNILFDDDDITRVPAHRRNIGMVFQDYALFPDKTVLDNVAYGLKARKIATDEVMTRSHEALDMVGLRKYAGRLPAQLSGGQRQRVALARALVIKPRVLLMDEPLSNLDAKLRLTMRDVIRDLQRQARITTVFVTHDQEEALALSDQIAVMQNGRIAQMGAPEPLYARPATAYVADFVGSANLLPVDFVASGCVAVAGQSLQVDTSAADAAGSNQLVLRAEALSLAPREETGGANQLAVTLLGRQYLGAKTLCRVALEGGQVLQVDAPGVQLFEPGQALWLKVPGNSRVICQ